MSSANRLRGPLAGTRVLELADHKGEFCGKLLADMGADVIKIEPPGGQSTRIVGPFLDDVPNLNRSLNFWQYNTSKRGVTLNLETEDGRRLFKALVPRADIVLESYDPGYLASLGLGYQDLEKRNPRLIMCSITPFGQEGPWARLKTSDLVQLAAGGIMGSTGYDDEDVAGGPPMAPDGGHAWHMGSHYSYMAIMAALYLRRSTDRGQYIDASIHEACSLTTESAIRFYIYDNVVVYRHTGRHQTPQRIDKMRPAAVEMETADGKWVHLAMGGLLLTPPMLRKLAEWMDETGMADDLLDDKYMEADFVRQNDDHVYDVLRAFFKTRPQHELWHAGQKMGFPWGAIFSSDQMATDPHLEERGFFLDVEHPELGRSFKYPGAAAIFNGSPQRIYRRAPLVGEHNEEILCREIGVSRQELAVLAEYGAV